MICRFILNFHSCFGLIFAKNMLLCLDFDSLECLMIYSFQKKHLVSYTMTTVAQVSVWYGDINFSLIILIAIRYLFCVDYLKTTSKPFSKINNHPIEIHEQTQNNHFPTKLRKVQNNKMS